MRLGPALLGLVAGEAEVHLLVHVVDPAERDQMVLAHGLQVQLGQFDLTALDVVHLAHVLAVRADHFHVLGDAG